MPSATPPEPAPQQPEDDVPGLEAHRAWKSFSYLVTGPLLYGGIGWLLDRWLGTEFLLPVGLVAGMALSLYLIWFRYGTH
jgi:F0F1-type ATP synthase assembly protein I